MRSLSSVSLKMSTPAGSTAPSSSSVCGSRSLRGIFLHDCRCCCIYQDPSVKVETRGDDFRRGESSTRMRHGVDYPLDKREVLTPSIVYSSIKDEVA